MVTLRFLAAVPADEEQTEVLVERDEAARVSVGIEVKIVLYLATMPSLVSSRITMQRLGPQGGKRSAVGAARVQTGFTWHRFGPHASQLPPYHCQHAH